MQVKDLLKMHIQIHAETPEKKRELQTMMNKCKERKITQQELVEYLEDEHAKAESAKMREQQTKRKLPDWVPGIHHHYHHSKTNNKQALQAPTQRQILQHFQMEWTA